MAETLTIFFGGETGGLLSTQCPGRLKYSMCCSSMSRCTREDRSGVAIGISYDSRFCFDCLSYVKPRSKLVVQVNVSVQSVNIMGMLSNVC